MTGDRCYNCKFWACVDSGYSNYTVLETTVHCLKNKFEPIDESYSWTYPGAKDSDFTKRAETCEYFKEGEGISLDVDGEITIEDYKDDEELYEAAKEYDL